MLSQILIELFTTALREANQVTDKLTILSLLSGNEKCIPLDSLQRQMRGLLQLDKRKIPSLRVGKKKPHELFF